MLDLNFQIEDARPQRSAAIPLIQFKMRIAESVPPERLPTPIHTVVLRCQIQIEPARRRYEEEEQKRLLDLFGTPERWRKTLRPLLWAQTSMVVKRFTGATVEDLPVPCSYDFGLAATKYFDALDGGEIPLCFLFSGTIFYEAELGGLQIAQIPWEKEAYYRLTASTWKTLMESFYHHTAWLGLRKDVFDQLGEYKRCSGLATWEQAVETLLAARKELAAP